MSHFNESNSLSKIVLSKMQLSAVSSLICSLFLLGPQVRLQDLIESSKRSSTIFASETGLEWLNILFYIGVSTAAVLLLRGDSNKRVQDCHDWIDFWCYRYHSQKCS